MRYKLLRWLNYKVFKMQEGELSHIVVRRLYRILFPLHWLYEKQSQIRYDAMSDTYTIRGVKVSGYYFECMSKDAERGRVFRFINNDNGKLTLELIK